MAARLQNGSSHPVVMSFWDKSQEHGAFEAQTTLVTVGNLTAQSGLWAALVVSTGDIVNGLPRLNRWVNQIVVNANPAKSAIDQLSAREIKLKIRYIDNTSQAKFECTVPTLDLSKVVYLPIIGNDAVSLSEPAEIVTFITDFQACIVAPYTGNPVTIIALEVVGRNN